MGKAGLSCGVALELLEAILLMELAGNRTLAGAAGPDKEDDRFLAHVSSFDVIC